MTITELAKSIVEVECTTQNGPEYGTAFFISEGLLLTCAHVVQGALSIKVKDSSGSNTLNVKARSVSPADDIALLEIDLQESPEFKNHEVVQLGVRAKSRDKVYSQGYTDARPAGDPVTAEIEDWFLHDNTHKLKLKNGQFVPGMSGSPLFNEETGQVCRIVSDTRDQGQDIGGLAVSMVALQQLAPYLHRLLYHASSDSPNETSLADLVRTLNAQTLDLDFIKYVFRQSLPGSSSSDPIPEQCLADIYSMIHLLSEFDAIPGKRELHPVFNFVRTVSARMLASTPKLAYRLDDWLNETYIKHRLIAPPPVSSNVSAPELWIRITSNDNDETFFGEAWVQKSDAQLIKKYDDFPQTHRDEILSKSLFEKIVLSWYGSYIQLPDVKRASKPYVTLELPPFLLQHSIETIQCALARSKEDFGKLARIELRSTGRDPILNENWSERWSKFKSATDRQKLIRQERIFPKDSCSNMNYAILLGEQLADSGESTDREEIIYKAMDSGYPVMIWGRESCGERNQIRAILDKHLLETTLNFPEQYFQKRKRDNCAISLHTAVVWDNFEHRASEILEGIL